MQDLKTMMPHSKAGDYQHLTSNTASLLGYIQKRTFKIIINNNRGSHIENLNFLKIKFALFIANR